MSYTDLTKIDLLEGTLANLLPKEQQEDLLNVYLESYANVLANALEGEFKPEDHEAMKKLLRSGQADADKIEKFYMDRIPHFQAKMTMLALEFKKKFLLTVYKNKLDEYEKSPDKTGFEAWKQVYADAAADNWNEVTRYLRLISAMGKKTIDF